MATAFKKSDQSLAELRVELEHQKVVQVGPDKTARQWRSDVAKMCNSLEELSAAVGKMVSKAKETDPDKQVYGKNMVAKVLDLGSRLDSAVKEANELQEKVAPLAEAEEARVAKEEAARKAEEEAEAARKAEEVRLAEEEAARKAAEEAEAARAAADAAKRAAEEEAKARAAAEEEAARGKAAEDARLAQQAKEKAEAEAKAKAEADAKAAAADEGAKKAEAEAKLKQQAEEAAKALAAAAASALGASSPGPASSGQPAAASAPSVALPAGVIKVLEGSSELRKLLSDAGPSKLVVVDFSAPWCGPCRAIAPFLEQLATEYSSSCVFVAVDCEASPANRELAAEAAIRAFPTFHFYKNSQRVHEMRGANREGIRTQIRAHAAAAAPSGSSGAGQAAARAPGQMAKDLMAALQVLKSNCSFDEFCTGTRTLVTFVSNVLAHPGDAKYRRVRMSNARFNSALGVRTGGVECMESVGFRKAQEGSDWFLVMDAVPPELQQVKTMLEEAMRSVAPPPPARAAPPPATGAGAGAGGLAGGLGAGGLFGAMGAGGLPGQGFGGMPGMEGLGGGAFGAQPPGMDAMMQQMMSNPQMMQAANRMMQNPQMMSHIRNMMAGGGMDPASMAQLQQQMMADPEMQQAAMQMMGGMGGGLGGMMGSPGFPAPAMNTGVPPPGPPASAPSQAAVAPTSNTSGAAGEGNEQDPQNMSEEELLQLAIRRSMEDQSGNGGGA